MPILGNPSRVLVITSQAKFTRLHGCVFAILAPKTEPVDPML